jgi:hypothetical protein
MSTDLLEGRTCHFFAMLVRSGVGCGVLVDSVSLLVC